MEKIISKPRQKLFSEDQLQDEFLGKNLSKEVKEKLSYGEWSPLLENIQLEDGSVKDAKIRFTVDKDGGLMTHFDFKSEKLEIPDKILNQKLTEEEQNILKSNKVLGPIKLSSTQEVYLKVDQELNKVVIKSAGEIGIPNKIGEYQLTEADKNKLANGEKLPTKVLKGKDGYFLCDLKMAEGNRGIEFSNIKNVSQVEAQELIEKLNKPRLQNQVDNVLHALKDDKSNLVNQVISAFDNNEKGKEQALGINQSGLSAELDNAIKSKDYAILVDLVKKGQKPTEEQIKDISQSTHLSREEKTILFTVLAPTEAISRAWIEKINAPSPASTKSTASEISIDKYIETLPLKSSFEKVIIDLVEKKMFPKPYSSQEKAILEKTDLLGFDGFIKAKIDAHDLIKDLAVKNNWPSKETNKWVELIQEKEKFDRSERSGHLNYNSKEDFKDLYYLLSEKKFDQIKEHTTEIKTLITNREVDELLKNPALSREDKVTFLTIIDKATNPRFSHHLGADKSLLEGKKSNDISM